ncbi:MAG: hypothetical protein ACI8TP_002529 [Acidimicrobiales bacterium]|jgi:hypothetical protein
MSFKKSGLVTCATLGLLFSACGGSSDAAEPADDGADRQAVIDWMLGEGETQESAECFADELTQYTAADFGAFDSAESEADLPEGMSDDVLAAAGKCAEG